VELWATANAAHANDEKQTRSALRSLTSPSFLLPALCSAARLACSGVWLTPVAPQSRPLFFWPARGRAERSKEGRNRGRERRVWKAHVACP
jgi:hypothetical protein